MSDRYLAVEDPEWHLVFDEKPPLGVSLHLLMEWGACIRGTYDPSWGVVAWRELPKMTAEQKRRMLALKAGGYDLKRHWSDQRDYFSALLFDKEADDGC